MIEAIMGYLMGLSIGAAALGELEEEKENENHKHSLNALLIHCRNKYYLWQEQTEKQTKLYGFFKDMAENEPDKLLKIWDKIVKTNILSCPEDISEDILDTFDVGYCFIVYDTYYTVDEIDDHKVHFKKYCKID